MLGKKIDEKMGEILVKQEILSRDQLDQALEAQKREGGLLGEILVGMKYLNERDIVRALVLQYGFPYLPLENYDFDKELVEVVTEEEARRYSVVPVDIIGDILTIAMSDPLNTEAVEHLERSAGKKIKIFISTVSSVKEAINRLYKTDKK